MAQTVNNLPAMRETQVWSLDWEEPLEKEMATHFSIIAWVIPWTEEPGQLYSPRSHKASDMTEATVQQSKPAINIHTLLVFSRSIVSDFFATPWTAACQAPLSMGFPRQEYGSGLPFPPPRVFLTQGLNLCLPRLLLCRWIFYHWVTWKANKSDRKR